MERFAAACSHPMQPCATIALSVSSRQDVLRLIRLRALLTGLRTGRIEGVAPGRIYAEECIIIHDSASVLTSQWQLLRNLFT